MQEEAEPNAHGEEEARTDNPADGDNHGSSGADGQPGNTSVYKKA